MTILITCFPVLELDHDVGEVCGLAEAERGGGGGRAHARGPVRRRPRRVHRGGLAQRRVHLHRGRRSTWTRRARLDHDQQLLCADDDVIAPPPPMMMMMIMV